MSEEMTNNETGGQPQQDQAPAPEPKSDQHEQQQQHQEILEKKEEIAAEPQADIKAEIVEAKQSDDHTAEQTADHKADQTAVKTPDQTKEEKENQEEPLNGDKPITVATSGTVVIENQEVVSSTTSKPRTVKSRRGSYQASRSYAGSFQNYGLAYLPYKSNFEPSEDARRRADEFLKTLKL